MTLVSDCKRLIIKRKKGLKKMIEGTDYEVKVQWNEGSDSKADFAFCDVAKSFAGHEFHAEEVKSVVVYDRTGKVYLYLPKDGEGHVIREKVVDIKSPEH
jgi:hypothetical protein